MATRNIGVYLDALGNVSPEDRAEFITTWRMLHVKAKEGLNHILSPRNWRPAIEIVKDETTNREYPMAIPALVKGAEIVQAAKTVIEVLSRTDPKALAEAAEVEDEADDGSVIKAAQDMLTAYTAETEN